MMSHPESETLAWERVKALENELARVRKVANYSVVAFSTWAGSLRTAAQGYEPTVRDGLLGLAAAFDDMAAQLTEGLGS